MTAYSFVPNKPEDASFEPSMVYVRKGLVWEYKYLNRDLRTEQPPDESELNAMGRDGWELAGLYTQNNILHLYFKRAVEG